MNTAPVYGLLGQSLKHSYSVPVHQAFGCPDYRLIEIAPEGLADFFAQTRIGGLNVTIPYKRAVMAYCDNLSAEAQAIGSVNTIVQAANGQRIGHNTDFFGLRHTAERAGIDWHQKKVLVFGSGGAALTAQAVARTQGARAAVLISRHGPETYAHLERHADAEVLINATPVGMYPQVGVLPADPALFPRCTGLIDLIYNPRRTAFLMRGESLGIPCADGLPMLVAQAAAAEELFFSRPIAAEEIEQVTADLRRERTNIVLIGMPGCGKSTIGAALATLSGRPLIDIDAEIANKNGPIAAIFAQAGEAAFRQLEQEHIARAGKESGSIIVTGGGAVTTPANLPALRQNGRIYHLERALHLLAREGRPLSLNGDLEAMYTARRPLYHQFADATRENRGNPHDVANTIWKDFYAHTDY